MSLADELVRLDGAAAVRHLFLVTAGLDSQVLGETEILGQVRRAYDAARAAGTTTREMDVIFSCALSTGRRIRRETALGPASRVRQLGRGGCRGAGIWPAPSAAGRCWCSARARRRRAYCARSICAARRAWRWSTGTPIAHGCWPPPGVPRRMAWERAGRSAAAVPSCCSSRPAPRGRPCRLPSSRAAIEGRADPLVTMDLSVPRNVEPEARHLPGIRLYDLDDLQRLCCPAAGTPAAALHDAEMIMDEELARLEQQLRGRAAAPRLAELHRHGAQVAEQEAAWALAQLEELSEHQRMVVREMADRLVRRVLYPVSRSIREE